jgi:hypothetical protein
MSLMSFRELWVKGHRGLVLGFAAWLFLGFVAIQLRLMRVTQVGSPPENMLGPTARNVMLGLAIAAGVMSAIFFGLMIRQTRRLRRDDTPLQH